MKALHNLPLPASLRAAIQAVCKRLTAEYRVERLILFGSVVRGEADAESDADLLIVLTERPTAQVRDRITSLILDVNLAYGTNLSELIVDRQTWDAGLSAALPLHAEIEAEGIRL
jgi:predicted nucleotidyltransferase